MRECRVEEIRLANPLESCRPRDGDGRVRAWNTAIVSARSGAKRSALRFPLEPGHCFAPAECSSPRELLRPAVNSDHGASHARPDRKRISCPRRQSPGRSLGRGRRSSGQGPASLAAGPRMNHGATRTADRLADAPPTSGELAACAGDGSSATRRRCRVDEDRPATSCSPRAGDNALSRPARNAATDFEDRDGPNEAICPCR